MEEGFIKKIYGKLAITNLGAILFAKMYINLSQLVENQLD